MQSIVTDPSAWLVLWPAQPPLKRAGEARAAGKPVLVNSPIRGPVARVRMALGPPSRLSARPRRRRRAVASRRAGRGAYHELLEEQLDVVLVELAVAILVQDLLQVRAAPDARPSVSLL
jgi:hypothetical protein